MKDGSITIRLEGLDTMSISTVAVTGGNGKIGSAILSHLRDEGYRTANLARGKRREEVSHEYLRTDLLDPGETYGSIAKTDPDAIVHMGTIPTPNHNPGFVTYESNVMSPFYVLEAAVALDVEAVCLASSINAIGSDHQQRPADIRYVPVDEEHPRTPDDPYGIGKHAMEVTADGVGRRPGVDLTIASLRYPWVATAEELRNRIVERDRTLDAILDSPQTSGRDGLFSYLHIEDAATAARKAIEAEFLGHEAFWVVAKDTTIAAPSERLVEEFYPVVERRKSFSGTEGLIDVDKAHRLLDWRPQHSWRDLEE